MLKVKFRVHGRGTCPTSDTFPKLRHAAYPAMTHNAKPRLCWIFSPKRFRGIKVLTNFLRILFRRLRQVLQVEPMCNSSTKSSSKQFKVFSWKQHNYNVIIFKFQGSATFPPLPLPPRAPTCTRWHIVCLGYVTTYSRVARIRIHFLETFQLY